MKKTTPPGKDIDAVHPVRSRHPFGARLRAGAASNGVHLIGIGGIGMSALAQWFLAEKWTVTGSDIVESIITRDLRERGVRVAIGQKGANIPRSVALVVRNQAIPLENPELREAARRNIKTLTYPEAIGRITWWGYQTIAVAGSHGKSTTTALAALALIRAGLDPTVIVGTRVIELGNTNFRLGHSDWLVLEADEYGKAFLHYAPFLTIVTNIDADHLDTYGNLSGVKKGFLDFLSMTRRGGALILNRDDKNTVAMRKKIARIAKERSLRVVWFSLRDTEAKKIRSALRLPGEHNVRNSLAVLRLTEVLKIPAKPVLDALHSYEGSWRRMEYRGELLLKVKSPARTTEAAQSGRSQLKALIYDDYGHHPTEIKATLQAFREKFPRKQIICVFQPHQAERLKQLWKEFQDAFASADISVIAPLYKVAGRDAVPTGRQESYAKYNSRELVLAIQKRHPKQHTFYIENLKNIRHAVETLVQTLGDDCVDSKPARRLPPITSHPRPTERLQSFGRVSPIVIMMGAGDIVDYTDLLLSRKKKK